MKKKVDKRQRLFLAGSGLALLVIVALPSKGGDDEPSSTPGPTPGPAVADLGAQASESSVAATPAELDAQVARAAALTWGRDPFRGPVRVQASVLSAGPSDEGPARRLTGISSSGARLRAVLDRAIVQVGDRLPTGEVVTEITPHSVTLSLDDDTETLHLGEER